MRSSPFASTYVRSASGDRALRALLDEQDRDAAVADRREGGEDRVDHRRREPERGLVEQEHVRLGDERAPDRELLLLAAGEGARRPAAELGEDREELVGLAERIAAVAAAPRREAEPEVLLDRELAEDPPALRDERDPARAIASGARPRSDAPARRTSPAAGRTTPMIACSVVDLPAPFGPIRPTSSPAPDLEVEPAHRRRPTRSETWSPSSSSIACVTLGDRALAEVGGRDVEVRRGSPPACPRRACAPGRAPGSGRRPPSRAPCCGRSGARRRRGRRGPSARRPANSGTSASGSPAAGSSRSTNVGSVASARATPSRRSSPCASVAAGHVGVALEREQPEQLVRPLARRAWPRADAERRDLDVLPHGQAPEGAAVLERPRDPGPAAPVRAPAGHVAVAELDAARRWARRSRRARSRASTCPRRSGRSGRRPRAGAARA